MPMTETEARAGVEYIDAELANILARAEERGDADLTEDEQTAWDEGLAERERLLNVVHRYDALRSLAKMPSHREETTPDPLAEPDAIREDRHVWDLDAVERDLRRETPEKGGGNLRSRALDAIERAPINDRSKEHITGLVDSFDLEEDDDAGSGARQVAAHIVAVSSKEYQRAWTKAFKSAVRTGTPDYSAVQVLQRAASLTDAAGGYAVPLPVDPTLILDDDGSVSPFRELSTVRTITTDQLRTVNATAVSASYDAEATEVSDDTPTWANIDITVRKAQAAVPFSVEIGMDYPGFTQDVAFLMNDAKMNLEATVFATGAAGSNQPIGIVTALTGGSYEVSSNSSDTFAIGDVYDIDEELPSRFSANATWVANKAIYQAIREAGGANLDDFWANLGQGRPNVLLGHPAREASAMDGSVTACADNYVLILGDFRWYWIVDRVGFSMELVPHLFATANNLMNGQRAFYGWWRNGADSVNDRAFRMLNVT